MKTWFTADQHFGHANIIEHCKRPFVSVEDMDDQMVARWNERVAPDDIIYHLGDFSLVRGKWVGAYFARLNGWIRVVPGGHDGSWVKSKEVFYSKSGHVVDILPPIHTASIAPKVKAVLCHYPMQSWEQSHYGRIHLHGHSHGASWPARNRLDVGVDMWDFAPTSGQFLADLCAATFGGTTITDGYQTWPKKCAMCGENTMSVVRIGKVQCSECG